MQRNRSSTFNDIIEDKPLTNDLPLFDELQNRLFRNRSEDLVKMCPNPEENKKLSKLEKRSFYSIQQNR